MQVVSHDELAEVLRQLLRSINTLPEKLSTASGGNAQEYYSREEAAEYLRMGTTKLDALTVKGHLRRAKLGDGPRVQVLYRRIDLDSFVQSSLEIDMNEARRLASENDR